MPRGNPSRWATTEDYPARALREEAQGTTRFTVEVGPNGRVASCSISGSSGNTSLDETTCRLVTQRARFDPKLDAEGNPTTGTYSNRIRWEIPE